MIICVKDQQSRTLGVVFSGESNQYDFPRWSGVHRVKLLVAELRQQGFDAFVIACVWRLSYLEMCIQIESPRRSEYGSFSVCVDDDMAQKWMFLDARLEHLVERERAMLETQYRTVSVCCIDCSNDQSSLVADVLSGNASTLVGTCIVSARPMLQRRNRLTRQAASVVEDETSRINASHGLFVSSRVVGNSRHWKAAR